MFRLPLLALARPVRASAGVAARARISAALVLPPLFGCRFRSTSNKIETPEIEVGIENQGAADLFDEVDVAMDAEWEGEEVQEGVFMSLPTPASPSSAAPSSAPTADVPTRPRRPQKNSIKHLNRLLSRHAAPEVPESELEEKFVRGRGPGGQAINKTNSSVSLRHIPTGIRIQSQPTRSREQNRVVARQILRERLDLMRARGELPGQQQDVERSLAEADGAEEGKGEEKLSKKERLAAEARLWSKQELRWEKERRRKANRVKKIKRRKNAEEAETGENETK